MHGSWSFLFSQLRQDAVHPPLDYIVLRSLEPLGPSDAERRIPAAVWGIGAVAAAGWLLRRRAGPWPAVAGMGFLALSPVHVRYSQELRPYSLGIFLILASLCALELWMGRPTGRRAALFFLLALATAYTLSLAAVSLAVAGAALALEDASSPDADRRDAALRFWKWSPALVLGLAAGYAPWIPVFARGVRSLSSGGGTALTLSRVGHLLSELTLSYKYGGFSFGPPRLYQAAFGLFLALVAIGAAVALRRRGLWFLAGWAGAGLIAIELLRHRSPGHFGSRYFLPAAVALHLLAGVGLADLLSRRRWRAPAAAALALLLVYEAASIGLYFREGRADWRPLARFLERRPLPIFTDNENSKMCLAYYLCGPEWLARGRICRFSITNVDGQTGPLVSQAATGSPFWLILSGMPSARAPREWSRDARSIDFPEAERVTLKRFDPSQPLAERKDAAVAASPSLRGT